tara:strand:- start:1883 stop:2209 length:327 start_codon:yes stop_codon:yes gene_type:complete
MATLKKHTFGEVMTMEHSKDYTGYLVRLNFSLGLGNNFSYSQFIESIIYDMKPENAQELFIEWSRDIDLNSDLIIIDSSNCELNTCASDFNDHTRHGWVNHCNFYYGV